jgi:hypothetical protein
VQYNQTGSKRQYHPLLPEKMAIARSRRWCLMGDVGGKTIIARNEVIWQA